MPSSTVIHMKTIARVRWLAISAWWAIVSLTPELNSSVVFIVGIGHGPIVVNGSTVFAGDAVKPACTLGQTALKSGHSTAFSRLPRLGTACTRSQNSAHGAQPGVGR